MASDRWTPDEVKAAVRGYLKMLRAEAAGQPAVKRRAVAELLDRELTTRTRGAVERRFQNISYVLDELGLPWIDGYKPLSHVGPDGERQISKILFEEGIEDLTASVATDNEVELQQRARRWRELSTDPPEGSRTVASREVGAKRFLRDPRVMAWVKGEAAGRCELCGEPGPFEIDGEPFLEVHHVKHLADGGSDTITNAVAICPNCHRRLHLASDSDDCREKLFRIVSRLRRE